MKNPQRLIIYVFMAAVLIGCAGNGGGNHEPKPEDSLYSIEALKTISYQDPERALALIDSAEMLGHVSRRQADIARAIAYRFDESTMGKSLTLCQELLEKGKLSPEEKWFVLESLVSVARMRKDDESMLKYGMQFMEVCEQRGMKAQALSLQAELGSAIVHLGRTDEGLAKMDDAIEQLDNVRRFEEMDAFIRATKRKLHILIEMERPEEVITSCDKILEKLKDFGDNPAAYDDGSSRLPTDERRPGYIDFYTGQTYAFLAYAYSMQASGEPGKSGDAKRCLALFEQTDYSKTTDGHKMISATWCQLGEFDKMLAFYDQLQAQWGDDTLHPDYAAMLYNRAIAAKARGNTHAGYNYLHRYIDLSEYLNDADRNAAAQEYAARYHEQEQAIELERKKMESKWSKTIAAILTIIVLLAVASLFFAHRQLVEIRKKNKILSKEISDRIESEERYLKLKMEKAKEVAEMNDAELYEHICDAIVTQRLYLDPNLDRQQLVSLFHLSKDRIGSAFSKGSPFNSLKEYLVEVRLEHAVRLLTEHPEMPIAEVSSASGFASGSVFARNFKQRYSLTPSEFRSLKKQP